MTNENGNETTNATNEEVVHTAEVKAPDMSGVKIVEKSVPRVLLEILTHCVEKDKVKMNKMLVDLQGQLSIRTAKHRVRILYYIDTDGKTEEEKIQWLKDKAKSKYIVFVGENAKYHVDKNFIRDTLIDIKKVEDSVAKLKATKVFVNKNKIEPKTKDEAISASADGVEVVQQEGKVIQMK